MNNVPQPDKRSVSFPERPRQTSLIPDDPIFHDLGEPRLEDLTLWFERLYEFVSSRNIEGSIDFERLNKADRQTVTCLFRGTIPGDKSADHGSTAQLLDDPLSLQLETNGRLYSLGLIEPDGTIYISEEFGKDHRHLSRHGLWSTAVDTDPSGDLGHVQRLTDATMFLVVDGLGHGPEANEASQLARETMSDHAQDDPLYQMEAIHEALKDTRGAVALTGRINHDDLQLKHCSVGDIQAKLVKGTSTKRLISGNGTLGYSLPDNLNQHTTKLRRGDSIVCHSDGVKSPDPDFFDDLLGRLSPSLTAVRIHDRFKKGHDDALVFVTRV